MTDRVGRTSAEVLRSLGLDALVRFLETTSYGVCVTGEDHTWVYLNPAAEEILGRPFEELRGADYLLHFPDHERDVLLALEAQQREGDREFYTNTVVQPDGTERSMTWSGTVIEAGGVTLAPAIFHETTPVERARRNAARLTAATVAGVDPEVEGSIRAEVVADLIHDTARSTRATSAVLLLEDEAGRLGVAAASGVDDTLGEQLATEPVGLSDLPAVEDLLRGRSVFLSDAADQLRGHPRTQGWVDLLSAQAWSGATFFSVRCEGRLTGCLVVLLPESVTSPSESELLSWTSLADQLGMVLGADRLRRHVWESSALNERSRIARDLHDSVSQALFSLHARAQVIRRALAADDRELALKAAEHLEHLSRQATTELRELVTELRSQRHDAEDLGSALRGIAEEVSRVDGLPVEIGLSPATLPAVDPATAEHITRITREALHNCVKHAGARSARLQVTVTESSLRVRVEDDGCGFDPGATRSGYGRHTMRERAQLLGGELTVASTPGSGTAVALEVPRRP